MSSAPGIAVPGSPVPASSPVAPGGAQGIQGIQGGIGTQGPAGPAGPLASVEVGSIKPWPSVTPPPTWMLMDGSLLSRTLYPDLFALIGTTFGAGDGTTTFNLPDLRQKFILNYGNNGVLTQRNLGDTGGEENHVLLTAELAIHGHPIAAGQFSHGHNINNTTATGTYGSGGGSGLQATPGNAISAAANTLPAGTAGNTGSGAGHNTMPPFLCLVYIIKVSQGGGVSAQAPIADQTQAGLVNILNGDPNSYIGGDNACHALLAPTIEYYDQDDLLAFAGTGANVALTKLGLVQTSGGAGSVAGAWNTNQPGHPGIAQLAPGTAASGWARYLVNVLNVYLDGNMAITIGGVAAIPTGGFSGPNQYFFGLASSAGPILSATQSYLGIFAATTSGPNWFYHARNAATSTVTDSGVAVGSTTAWFKFKVEFLLSGQANFYINDNLVGTIAGGGSIPAATTALFITFFTNNATGTSNFSLLVDCLDIWLQPTAQSGQSPTRFMRRIL